MYHPSVDCFSLTGIIIEVKKKKTTDFWQSHCPICDEKLPSCRCSNPRIGVVHRNLLPSASAHAERRVGCIEHDDPRTQGGSDTSPSLIGITRGDWLTNCLIWFKILSWSRSLIMSWFTHKLQQQINRLLA